MRTAADWFVKLEQEELTEHEAAELAAWLEADPEHAASLARCAAAYDLAARMELPAPTPISSAEAPLATVFQRGRSAGSAGAAPTLLMGHDRGWFALMSRPAVAWSITVIAVLAAGASWLRQPASPAEAADREPPSQRAPAAWSVSLDPGMLPAQPVVVLPGQVIVDALSLGVRPFVPADPTDAAQVRLASDLHRRIAAHIASIPGFYVPPAEATAPFSEAGLSPTEMAVQLGVRAVLEARVSSDGGEVEVRLRLTDASSSTLLLESVHAAAVTELDSLQAAIVARIGLAMVGPTEATARIND